MFARAFGILCFCFISYHIHTWQFVLYISFRLQKLNRKIAYCCICWCSLVLSASSAVYAWFRTTYLAVRCMHIMSSSKIKPENRVLHYTLMFARAFGIFGCLCFNSRQIAGSSWYTYPFVFKNSTGKSRTAVYVDVRSCFRHLMLLLDFVPHAYLAVRGVHIISSSKIKPENRVLLYTFMFARAFGIFCCLCFNSHHIPGSSWYTYHFVFKN